MYYTYSESNWKGFINFVGSSKKDKTTPLTRVHLRHKFS